MQPAHGLHHGVDLRVIQDGVEALHRLGIRKLNVLQAQHLRHLHVVTGPDDLINAPANHAEAAQSDFHITPPLFKLYGKLVSKQGGLCMRYKNSHPREKVLAIFLGSVYHILCYISTATKTQ